MLNKHEQLIAKEKALSHQMQNVEASLDNLNNEPQLAPCVKGGIVQTPYLEKKVNRMINEMERRPYGHFAVCGPHACGKISLIKLVMQLYNERYR